jgi:predicted phage baseplate assembly protein
VTVVVPTSFNLPAGVSTALLEDATGAGTVVQVTPTQNPDPTSDAVAPALSRAPSAAANFDAPLQVPLRLLFDVVTVSQGTTVTNEVLGSGNAALANQSFTLQKSPLTYLASGAGWKAALAVYVDNIQWSKVPTLYNQPPRAQVYVVGWAPDQSATIRFGDGVNGSRLTSGTGNVVATYRYGSGAASPPAGRLTTIVQRQPNLAAIHNPVAVGGGKNPQAPGDVKANAPASVFTFGRTISALDYEVVAAQAAGVTRTKAYWTFDAAEQRTMVKIYVNDDAGGVVTATQALAGSDDPNRPVTVAAAQPIDVSVSATLVVAANRVVNDVVATTTAAFTDPATGVFSPAQMGIGQWLYRSRIAAALSVPGVVAVHQLEVTWTVALDQVADPGEGGYFQLLPANLTLTGVPANG